MPNQGYTVSPVVSVTAEGEEYYSDVSISTGAQSIGRDGMVNDWQKDYVLDNKGEYHHVFENVELDEDPSGGFDLDEYVSDIFSVNEHLEPALRWAENNLHPDIQDNLNTAFKGNNLNDLNQAIEWLLEQYHQRPADEPQQVAEDPDSSEDAPDDEMENLSDEEKQVLSEAVEQLGNQEPQGEEYAEAWQDMIEQAEEAGDITYAKVAAATASFHAGEVSAEEAINFCLNECDLSELARVYQYMMSEE